MFCKHRKAAHYSSARNFGWKNKLLSIPTILISTILGSLSFIHPSFMEQSSSRMLSERNLQPEWPACVCNSYLNGALSSESDLCQNAGTTECYPMSGDWSCSGSMFSCINMPERLLSTEAPTPESIIYDEALNGEADGTANVGVDTAAFSNRNKRHLGHTQVPERQRLLPRTCSRGYYHHRNASDRVRRRNEWSQGGGLAFFQRGRAVRGADGWWFDSIGTC